MDDACSFSESSFGEATVLAVSGELDMAAVPELRRRLGEALAEGVRQIVIDLSEVTFIDSLSLAVIVATKRALEPDGRLALVADSEFVVLQLRATGLVEVLRLFGDLSEAETFVVA